MGLTGSADSTIDLQTGLFVQSFVIGPQKGGNGFDGSPVVTLPVGWAALGVFAIWVAVFLTLETVSFLRRDA